MSFLQKKAQILKKITNFFEHQDQVSQGYINMCYKDMYSLLLEHLLPSLRYIAMVGSTSEVYLIPLLSTWCLYLPKVHSDFKRNNQLWAPDHPGEYEAEPEGHASMSVS